MLSCWNCHSPIGEVDVIFCNKCGLILPPYDQHSPSYFTVLGLPVGFGIAEEELSDYYLKLQKILHPDLFIQKSAYELELAKLHIYRVNEAYQQLKNPLTRAEHMLALAGQNLDNCQVANDVLEEVLSIREELENLYEKDKIVKTKNKLVNLLNICYKEFDCYYAKGCISDAVGVFMKMKYVDKIMSDVCAQLRLL
jgi:Fe-S protein assembly co-chaperone HscB